MRASPYGRRVLRDVAPALPQPPLLNLSTAERCDPDYEQLTVLQQTNDDRQMQTYVQMMSPNPDLPQLAVIDCVRQPDAANTFEPRPVLGFNRTLRTSNQGVWLLPAPSLQGVFGAHGRRLARDEKIRCCGFEPSWLSDISDSEATHAIGNAIPPPIAGHVLFPVSRAWAYAAIDVKANAL